MPISVLPPHIIHHIAAGEVIDRPVSVVKELIDNSLDAGATRIRIEIEDGGLKKIFISDNGEGITQQDAAFMFTRYATSKLSDLSDFSHLNTLGFRGEGLFSIMSVGDVTVETKHRSEQFGTHVQTFHGQVEEILRSGHRTGTDVTVERLFMRFPVRRRGLRPKAETVAITQLVEKYALAFPRVAFILTANTEGVFSVFENENPVERISFLWQHDPNEFMTLEHVSDRWKLSGWSVKPEYFLRHARQQLIIINSRIVEHPRLRQTIERAFKTFQHKGRFPAFVFFLEVNPAEIDMNVHPQKRRIMLMYEDEIIQEIETTLTNLITASPTLPDLQYGGTALFPLPPDNQLAEKKPFQLIGEISQLNNTYLLAQTDQGMLLVDQHAADEKLWYNRLLADQKLLDHVVQQVTQECQAELDDDIYQHSFEESVNAKIATLACHQAIRAGQALTQEERQQLIKKILAQGTQALTCPHGRPTYIHVSLDQLAGLFRRK